MLQATTTHTHNDLDALSPTVFEHGGGCCGIVHLSNFYSYPGDSVDAHKAFIARGVSEAISTYDHGCDCWDPDECGGECNLFDPSAWECAIEIVLAGYQFNEWHQIVIDSGFKQVHEFTNSNSGNVCRVYYMTTGG